MFYQAVVNFLDRHQSQLAKDNRSTCSTGSWVINQNAFLCEKKEGLQLKTIFSRLFGKKTDNVECNVAEPCVCTQECKDACRETCKILVVSNEPSFSREIISYSVSMAAKTDSSIVALNIYENGHEFSQYENESCSRIEAFSSAASKMGLCFNHLVEHGKEDNVIAQLHAKDPMFRYVINDVPSARTGARTFPVYTRATMRAK